MAQNEELLARASQLRSGYVQPWVDKHLRQHASTSKEDEARLYLAFQFFKAYDDAACDEKVIEALTSAVVWLHGFYQFKRKGDRERRARQCQQLRDEAVAAKEESISALWRLVPLIDQVFVGGANPIIAKLSS